MTAEKLNMSCDMITSLSLHFQLTGGEEEEVVILGSYDSTFTVILLNTCNNVTQSFTIGGSVCGNVL